MHWGLSEALDLYQEYIKAFLKLKKHDEAEEISDHNDEEYSEIVWDFGEETQEIKIETNTFIETDKELNFEKESQENNSQNVTVEIEKETSLVADNNSPERVGNIKESVENMDINSLEPEKKFTNSDMENKQPDISKGAIKKIKTKPKDIVVDKLVEPTKLNILLFGSSDPRHILKTMAKLYTHRLGNGQLPEIHFYVVDGCIELTARNILLLSIALENPKFFSLINKTHLFMDLYGNSLLRPTSHHYMVSKAKALLKIITDPDLMKELAPMLDLDYLKYIERDGLENAFNFWLPKPGNIFEIANYWDNRNRHLLGERYDFKTGAFDWDLSMTLKDRQGKQICNQEYRYWRETGIAFTYPEYEQCKPNKTLSVGLIRNGEKYKHRGYAGDIQTGPYCAFGLITPDSSMLNSNYGTNEYRSTDITERNLLEIMHELQIDAPYVHNTEWSRKFGAIRLQMGKCLTADEEGEDAVAVFLEPWIHKEGVHIHFLASEEIHKMQKPQNRWHDFFDVVFLGHNYYPFIEDMFGKVLKPQSLLIMETKSMTVLRQEQLTEFQTKLINFAKLHKFEPVINYNSLNAKFTQLKYKRETNVIV